MKRKLINFKSNKGFTIQDVAIAIVVLVLFAGVIAGSYLSIYRIQVQTKLTAVASIYGIQIMENIQKISYDEVVPNMEDKYRSQYQIPDAMGLEIEVIQHDLNNQIKDIKLTISYTASGKTENIVLQELKVKEL